MLRRKSAPLADGIGGVASSSDVAKLINALPSMPFPELREIKQKIDAAVAARTEEARASFADQLEMFGLSLGDAKPVKKKRQSPKVKYRDPDNPENTWNGIGKQRKWLQSHLEAGRSLEEFLVE